MVTQANLMALLNHRYLAPQAQMADSVDRRGAPENHFSRKLPDEDVAHPRPHFE